MSNDKKTSKEIHAEEGYHFLPPPSGNETAAQQEAERELENQDNTQMTNVLFASHIKSMQESRKILSQNLVKLWAVIYGQCTPVLQEEISGDPEYATKSANFDSIWLLQTLQNVTAGVNKTSNLYVSAFKANKSLYNTCQQRNETFLDSFLGRMENAWTTVELFDTDVVDFDKLLKLEHRKDPNAKRDKVIQKNV